MLYSLRINYKSLNFLDITIRFYEDSKVAACWKIEQMKKKLLCITIALLIAVTVSGTGCTSNTSGARVQVAGSTTIQPHAEALAKAFQTNNSSVTVFVQGGGSSAGVTAVGTGTADIGMSSANLTASQLARYPNLKPVPIAVDGLAVIINPQNPVNSLTLNQVRDIFSGSISNWNQVGGPNQQINIVNREIGSGTRDGIQKIVLKNGSFSSRGITQSSTGAVRSFVAADPNAIGYISFAEVDNSVKALGIDGVAPTYASIANGTYPIQRDLLFVTNGDPSVYAKAFLDFTLSPSGQAILKADNVVSIKDVSVNKLAKTSVTA
jgi:phosphate transport system substrate-binding protein